MTSNLPEPSQTWRPILDGAAREEAFAAVAAIAADLARLEVLDTGEAVVENVAAANAARASLGWGWPGLALLFAYRAGLPGAGPEDREACLEQVDRSIDSAGEAVLGPSLHLGFSGLGWLLSHLEHRVLGGFEDDPNEMIDEMLGRYLGNPSSPLPPHDLLSGLLGTGVYLLERPPSPGSRGLLEELVGKLEREAVHGPAGLCWWTRPEQLGGDDRAHFPQGHCSLGLAHGMSGAIALLSRVHAAGVAPDRTAALIEGAVSWLLAQRRPEADLLAFPTYITPAGARRVQRAAWCHGDPGIATALFLAGRQLGRSEWERAGIELAREVAELPEERTGVVDPGLCHGAAGLLHMLNRIYQATGEERLRAGALAWAERTLRMRAPSGGIGGFRSRPPDVDGRPSWHDTPGLLQGGAGIALALLAAATGVEPCWDRSLLLS